MAKLQNTFLLSNSRGQSAVEYILLLAVMASIGYAFFNNPRFKNFIGNNSTYFQSIQKGMAYSYRYGRELKNSDDFDQAMSFDYRNSRHDTYYNPGTANSRFFTGVEEYGTE